MLSKYSVAFYLVSLLPALLLTKQRTIFLNRHLYQALALAFLIFLPNLIWQYVNHFPVIYHMHELSTTQLQYVPLSVFLLKTIADVSTLLFHLGSGVFLSAHASKRQAFYIFMLGICRCNCHTDCGFMEKVITRWDYTLFFSPLVHSR